MIILGADLGIANLGISCFDGSNLEVLFTKNFNTNSKTEYRFRLKLIEDFINNQYKLGKKENGCDDFNGMNCDDGDCGGWDGESHRCYCGNRRVMLLTEQRTDGTWVAYGEAY